MTKKELPDSQNQSNGNSESECDPNGSEHYRQGAVKHSMCNSQNGINPIDHACSVSSLHLNSNLNRMSSCPNGIESVLKEANEEPQKSVKSDNNPYTIGVSKPCDTLSETSPGKPNEASPPHMPDRVSKNKM